MLVFNNTFKMRFLAVALLGVLAFSSRVLGEFKMPNLAGAKSVSVCQLVDEEKLTRICDWVEPSAVKNICAGIVASEVRPGRKIMLESGPILVLLNSAGEPLIAFMQTLDGWLAAFAVDRKEQEWTLGKALMEPDEYRRPTSVYSCWDLVYRIWLHAVNPELYKAGQIRAGQPNTHSGSEPEERNKSHPPSEARPR